VNIFHFIIIALSFSLSFSVHAKNFIIIPESSEIRILVYRKGVLSALGHNHVIISKQIQGTIYLNEEDISQSRLAISMPVNSLIVDDPSYRIKEGRAFASTTRPEDIEATSRNMLSKKVLDGDAFPFVEVTSVSVSGDLPELKLVIIVSLHGVSQTPVTPVNVQYRDSHLLAIGKLAISQRDFGITPLSMFFGAIAVKNIVNVRYRIFARAE